MSGIMSICIIIALGNMAIVLAIVLSLNNIHDQLKRIADNAEADSLEKKSNPWGNVEIKTEETYGTDVDSPPLEKKDG